MTTFQTLAILLTLAALGAYINYRFLELPATIGLMVVALLISLVALGLNNLGLINVTASRAFISGGSCVSAAGTSSDKARAP